MTDSLLALNTSPSGGGGGGGATNATIVGPLPLPVTGPLTDAQLRSAAVSVTGPLTDAQLRATAIPVSVGNFPTTQPVSVAALPLPAGAASEATAAAILARTPELSPNGTPVAPSNVTQKFREAFETYIPGEKWNATIAPGDIVQLDGNSLAASYLVISKDPLTAGVTTLETVPTFEMPLEISVGLSLSQRTLGQEISLEVVDTAPGLTPPADIQISSIQQATTTLTVNTATAHGLKVGQRIGIRDCADSRFNYPALVVATTPTPTQFTVTGGPGGTIPSVTAGPFASGFVFFRSALGYAQNGFSQIFENATATNASFYVRSESGDVLPSGVAGGNHSITVATTASVQAAGNTALNFSFQPTSEYRSTAFVDGVQFSDVPVDNTAAATNRVRRTQVVPDYSSQYRLRFRATNNASLTRPVAQIVSVAKTGTTTATVTTDVPHGLTTGDFVNTYGVRDQVNFANLTTAVAVASAPTATTFTVVWGSAVTATSYGGYVARVNGGNLMSALGALTVVGSTVSRTANIVTLVGSGTWSGVLIGDYVNLVGVRDNSTGASLNLDGPYRVRDIQTTSLFLEPIGTAPAGSDITSTACGGGVIKRTDLRISFARILGFERQRVEIMPRPASDASSAAPVTVQNTAAVSGTVGILAGTNLIGDVNPSARPGVAGAVSATHLNAAASTNATVARNAACRWMGYDLTNTTGSFVWLVLHNSATTPTAGAGVVRKIGFPPNSARAEEFDFGIAFSTGLAFTTVTGAPDSDATAVTANALVGEILWT